MSTDLPKPRLLACPNVSTGQVDEAPLRGACRCASVLALHLFVRGAPERHEPSGTRVSGFQLFRFAQHVRHVRSSPRSRHLVTRFASPIWANSGLTQQDSFLLTTGTSGRSGHTSRTPSRSELDVTTRWQFFLHLRRVWRPE
jgi:hypothetical protein